MAGSFSSKKVARAARTGGGRRRNANANLGYYSILVAITLVFGTLVVVSRNDRLQVSTPNKTPPLEATSTRAGDRWYESYGIYVCDKFLPNVNTDDDPFGFPTKNDGIIYIHPYEKKYAGKNATLGLFAEGVGIKLTHTSINVPGEPIEYKNGSSKCGDKAGKLVLKEWTKASDAGSGTIITSDPRKVRLKDGAAVTIAFVPEGETNIPIPPSAANLDSAKAADEAALAAQQQQAQTQTQTEVPATSSTPSTEAPTSTTPAGQ